MFGIGNIKSTVLKTLTGSHTVSGLGVVAALGKPYIKLEFEDNAELLDFKRQMQQGGEAEPVAWDEKEEMFVPMEEDGAELDGYGDKYTVIDNRKRAKKEPGELVANKNLVFTKEVSNSITNYNHTVINNPDYKEITILFQSQQYETHFPFFHVTKKARKETHSTQTGKDGQLYDGHIVYIKVPVEVEKLYNLDRNSHTAYISLSYYKDLKNKAFKQFLQSWQNTFTNYKEQIKKIKTNTYLNASTKESWIKEQEEYLNDALKTYKYNCDFYGIENDSEKEINLGAPGDVYLVTDTRKNPRKELDETAAFKKFDIEKFNNNMLKNLQTNDPLLYEQIKSDISDLGKIGDKYIITDLRKKPRKEAEDLVYMQRWNIQEYTPTAAEATSPSLTTKTGAKKTNATPVKTSQRDIENIIRRVIMDYGITNVNYDETVTPLVEYFTQKGIRSNPDKEDIRLIVLWLQNYNYLKERKPELYNKIVSDLNRGVYSKEFETLEGVPGLTVNDQPAAVFNFPEAFLQTKGFTPTYTRLEDYSALIEPATGEKRLVGYGFEAATLDQLKNACKNYKQVAKLAAHLKGDTELQSAFNVWHWLHTNIKYNYDAPGQEEIRTPARTFADRESGVDCDCLAVFAACLLGAMGYKPRFEIVAFGNSPKFSHIYVNLNGAAVDRVLPVFLARPSGITKTKIMEIPVFALSGGSAMEAAATLNGIYETALAKVQAHEATAEDSADLRKSQVLMTLQNSDPQAYRLAAILMPYVVAIDDDGAWYFADAKVAEIADKADKKLYELKISEVNENIFNDFFNEILNEFKNITVKVERGSGTTVLTIAFTNPADDAVTITGDYVKKDFVALNPNFLTMRESLKNLLAVNYLGLASKYAVGLMTEQEAVAAGYSVETWKMAVKAFETLTRFWILIGGKAENIADIILNGSTKEPLTDKNINYEANIVATSDTDAILSGCKKRGLSGLNGLGETPTVASDIENLGEEGLEKILDWCSEIETEAEKETETSDENPVNVLAQNATPAAAGSAPAATGTKKNSLLWWLLGGAALGGGIAAATGGKKNKRR